MSKVLPAMIVMLGVPIGMGVGGCFGRLTLGSAIGGGVGFVIGLAVLIWMRRPRA